MCSQLDGSTLPNKENIRYYYKNKVRTFHNSIGPHTYETCTYYNIFVDVGHQNRNLAVDGDTTRLLRQPYVWEGQSLFMATQRKTSDVTLKQLFQLRRIFCRGTMTHFRFRPASNIHANPHILTLFLVPPFHIFTQDLHSHLSRLLPPLGQPSPSTKMPSAGVTMAVIVLIGATGAIVGYLVSFLAGCSFFWWSPTFASITSFSRWSCVRWRACFYPPLAAQALTWHRRESNPSLHCWLLCVVCSCCPHLHVAFCCPLLTVDRGTPICVRRLYQYRIGFGGEYIPCDGNGNILAFMDRRLRSAEGSRSRVRKRERLPFDGEILGRAYCAANLVNVPPVIEHSRGSSTDDSVWRLMYVVVNKDFTI